MKILVVNSIEQWNNYADRLTKAGYKLYITQYRVGDPEGLHCTFWAKDKPDVEFVTHNKAVSEAMLMMPT
jgi:hypothetical protein